MKKTLTVNISGIVFHIDEDAYNVLNDYLQSIRKHFSRTEGRDEIVSDIEARIAEMLKDRIGDERQVITLDDIEEVIKVIGLPDEFGEDFKEDKSSDTSGVSGKAPKRLYRDPENSILGGVCGGLGAYFHSDPVWFRLAFVVLCIPGIGTPLLVYVILWIVIPEARTAAERLEMRGEKVNIPNIEKSIREEIANLKNKFNEFTKGAKRTYKKKSAAHRSDIQGLENALSTIVNLFVRGVLIFTGFILSIIGIGLIVSLLILLFGFGFDFLVIDSDVVYISLSRLSEIFIGPAGNSVVFQISFLLLLGIPVALLLYAGIKLIFGFNKRRHIGTTAFYIWLVSIIICAFYGISIFREFSHKGLVREQSTIDINTELVVKVSAQPQSEFDKIYRYGDYFDLDETNIILSDNDDNMLFLRPEVTFENSGTDRAGIEIIYFSRGSSDSQADERAGRLHYRYSVSDGQIFLDPCFQLPDREVWRKQKIEVIVKVPEGTVLKIDENLRSVISDKRYSPYRLAGESWIMTNSGLEKAEENPIIPDTVPSKSEKDSGYRSDSFNSSFVFNLTGVISGIIATAVKGI